MVATANVICLIKRLYQVRVISCYSEGGGVKRKFSEILRFIAFFYSYERETTAVKSLPHKKICGSLLRKIKILPGTLWRG